mmetsp:Transcript_9703/g.18870  ORF Transcript_9703/g.18870 Transcript_9703/m.18870 type:complete len:456 (-) Transcript_9703:33-1400(-)
MWRRGAPGAMRGVMLATLVCLAAGSAVPLEPLDDKNAKCLDGSPGGFYHQPALAADMKRMWVIHLQGGGECSTADECAPRLQSPDGSSTFFPPLVNFSFDPSAVPVPDPNKKKDSYDSHHYYDIGGIYRGTMASDPVAVARRQLRDPTPDPTPVVPASWMRFGWWLLGDTPKTNPDLWGWNHVLVPYCSQDLHSGQRDGPIHVGDMEGLYFAGHLIVEAILTELDKRGLKGADTIVLSGHSAGGIGTWLHVDWMQKRYPEVRVLGAPIAGFYFFSYQYDGAGSTADTQACSLSDFSQHAWPSHWQLWDGFIDESCALKLNDRPWECMVANVSAPFIDTPMFITQSQTDQVVLQDHDCIPSRPSKGDWDVAVTKYVKEWHKNMTVALHLAVNKTQGQNGMFSAACYTHTNFSQSAPLIKKRSFMEAFTVWLNGGQNGSTNCIWEDDCGEICNPTCT